MPHKEIIQFWFEEIEPKAHWKKDPEFDSLIESRFGKLHTQANLGELFSWRKTAEGCLAEIIILDQFSRNMFRNQPAAFASDALALALSQTAVAQGLDVQLPAAKRSFLYMPYMHSESQLIHDEAVKLFDSLGIEPVIKSGKQHKAIVDRFGRYPHRNDILGRDSTAEEIEFLTQPNSSF